MAKGHIRDNLWGLFSMILGAILTSICQLFGPSILHWCFIDFLSIFETLQIYKITFLLQTYSKNQGFAGPKSDRCFNDLYVKNTTVFWYFPHVFFIKIHVFSRTVPRNRFLRFQAPTYHQRRIFWVILDPKREPESTIGATFSTKKALKVGVPRTRFFIP